MKIPLINVKYLLYRVTSSGFSEMLLGLMFLKNNELKIILMPKKHYFGQTSSVFLQPKGGE